MKFINYSLKIKYLYGTWFSLLAMAMMTCPKLERDLLMFFVSFSLSPTEPD